MKEKSNIIFKSLTEIDSRKTIHGIGEKQVLINNLQCESNLMQAAYGKMQAGEEIETHVHKTMEEFYFFNKGIAVFTINEIEFLCEQGTFVKIPANTEHKMKVIQNIEFIYWGVAV